MDTKTRIRAIRLAELIRRQPETAKKTGVEVSFQVRDRMIPGNREKEKKKV
ncbi:MAG: hypothetical protein ACOYBC_00875 [Bilifractor sp.]|jgi:hypothetical protein